MRLSQSFYRTLKEIPKDAAVPSHQLMFRTGMIQQLASGIYSYLPLALRSIHKIERIIREELNRRSCEEILMPAVQPAELWKESGRWDLYGELLLRFKDRKGNDYCMGPTHEEVITDIVRNNLKSWRQLPWNLYQIQDKFRDEFRPRFGLMRGREFIMKDAYSFDIDKKSAQKSFNLMFEAYNDIFKRCGLEFRAVDASTGEIGGEMSREFQVLASTGEDIILSCDTCSYAVNREKAVSKREITTGNRALFKPMEIVETPGAKTIQDVSNFLNIPPDRFLKCLVYEADSDLVLALIAGNKDVNESKLQSVLNAASLKLASEETAQERISAEFGSIGPVGLPSEIKIITDISVSSRMNWMAGANAAGRHYRNVNPGRDFEVTNYHDIVFASAGERCSECGQGSLEENRGIEVGHIFYLGTKYSRAMDCCFLDKEGNSQPVEMGCYGIGVGRTMAAAIEQNHDENGIIWPVPIAPWEVIIIPLQINNHSVVSNAEKIYSELSEAGLDVILDDRDERPGFKFKDADLIGYPVQIILGTRSVADGNAEVKFRASGKKVQISLREVSSHTASWIKSQLH